MQKLFVYLAVFSLTGAMGSEIDQENQRYELIKKKIIQGEVSLEEHLSCEPAMSNHVLKNFLSHLEDPVQEAWDKKVKRSPKRLCIPSLKTQHELCRDGYGLAACLCASTSLLFTEWMLIPAASFAYLASRYDQEIKKIENIKNTRVYIKQLLKKKIEVDK